MTEALPVIAAALAGALIASALACLPGLHIFNVLGLLVLMVQGLAARGLELPPVVFLPLMTGMIVGWSMLNTIPSILLGAPDESALFTVLPGQKYLMYGRGFEGVMLTAAGGLGGLFLLTAGVGLAAPRVLPVMHYVLRGHMHWILWAIIAFILLSEWPKEGTRGPSGWRKFARAWSTLAAGLATFVLAGLLGFILLYRSPVPAQAAFQNIMPAFVGLFAVPWCLMNLVSGAAVPPQSLPDSIELDAGTGLRGVGAGGLGGGFAAFFPVITGGVGGLLAGHATAQRDERVFIVSQGTSKLMYYAGAFLMLFVPGLGVTRGGAAWLLRGLYTPRTAHDYYLVLAALAFSGAAAYLMMEPFTRGMLWLMRRVPYRLLSGLSLLLMAVLVGAVTGWAGMAIAAVATGIGLLPVLFGSRRLNCLGVLLLPIACNMSGLGEPVARALRLL